MMVINVAKRINSRVSEICGFLGFVCGAILLGPRNIWFTNLEWLSNDRLHIDAKAAQISWNFFRHTQLLQWPLTQNPNYGFGSDTLFQTSAGNLLFGVPLKYLNFLLPDKFQYLGFWIVVCFFLQGYFAAKIVGLWSKNSEFIICSSIFFVIAPVFIHRMGIMGQLDMASHWVILASIYTYLLPEYSVKKWFVLNTIALFIGPYLALIVYCVFAASLVKTFFENSRQGGRDLIKRFIPVIAIAATFFALGYNKYGNGSAGPGFFRLNMGSFIYPVIVHDSVQYAMASSIFGRVNAITSRPFIAFEGEGFNFVGLATLILVPLGVVVFLKSRKKILVRSHLPLLGVSLVLLIFAFSNRIALGRREIILPSVQIVDDIRMVFRSATRFAWPATYLALIYGLIALQYRLKRVIAISILSVILILQVFDTQPLMLNVFSIFHHKDQELLLKSDAWNSLGESVDSLVMVPTFDYVSDGKSLDAEIFFDNKVWFRLMQFASVHNLRTNFVYSGRPLSNYITESNIDVSVNLNRGLFADKTIYVFANKSTWESSLQNLSSQTDFSSRIIDGFYLIIMK